MRTFFTPASVNNRAWAVLVVLLLMIFVMGLSSVRSGGWPEATRLRAELQMLSFGDGTGYFGNHPYPPPGREKQNSTYPTDKLNKSAPPSKVPLDDPKFTEHFWSTMTQPASLLP